MQGGRFLTRHGTAGPAYLSGASSVLLTRVFSLVASALALWLLSGMLSAAQFAGYTAAMSAVLLLGLGAGFGIERALLMAIAGREADGAALLGARMMRRIALVVVATGCAIGLAAVAVWSVWPALSADVPVAEWLARLWPIVPASALTLALVTWYQANHIFGLPQMLWGLADVTRCAGFAAVFALGLGAPWVAVSALVAAALPIAVLTWTARGLTDPEPRELRLRDVRDGLQFFVIRFSAMAFIHLDVLVLSLFAPGPVVAQYVIASRLAAVLETGHQVFTPAYAARTRRHLDADDPSAALREYGIARTLGFFLTLPVIALFFATGPHLLALFGEFGTAFSPFAALLAGHLLNVGFGNHAIHLSMTRDLPFAAANRAFGLVLFLVLLLAMTPDNLGMGAATAFFVALAVYNWIGVALMKLRQGVWIAGAVPMAVTWGAAAAIWLAALDPARALLAALLVVGCAVGLLVVEWRLVTRVLGEIRTILTHGGGTRGK